MKDVLLFAILGIGAGASYALIALGIVLIQKGSGAVNFAQGAIAGCSAIFFASATNGGMGKITALLIALAGAATLGVVFYVLVMRPLRTAPLLARIVATLGLMIVLSALAVKVWGSLSVVAPSLFPTDSLSLFDINFGVDRLYLLGVTIVLTVVLWAVYRFTTFGISTRAVAESERGASLLGLSPDLIGAANWALGCMLAAFAGVMIAPLTTLDISPLTLLILPALAAALVGRFSSFGITAAVALLIGMIQSLLVRYWTQPGVIEAVPFVIVIVTMIAGGKLIPARGTLSLARLPLAPASRFRPVPALVPAAIVVLGLITLNGTYQSAISTSLVTVIIALSAVVVTGFVGQISLMQMAFAGIGGFMVSKLGINAGIPFPWPIILAALCAVPVGVLLGLPAVRVRGINLAVVTLGAAVAVSAVVFQNAKWTGGVNGSQVPVPGDLRLLARPGLARRALRHLRPGRHGADDRGRHQLAAQPVRAADARGAEQRARGRGERHQRHRHQAAGLRPLGVHRRHRRRRAGLPTRRDRLRAVLADGVDHAARDRLHRWHRHRRWRDRGRASSSTAASSTCS